jgi:hypothetical protein
MMIRQRRYLQTAFGHLRTMWTSVGEEGLEALVEAEHPDAIIDQRVEQNLAADLSPRPLPNVVIMAEAALPAAPSGWVHIDERNPAFWRVNGWALWHPDQETVRLRVATNLSVRGYLIDRVERGDVSAAQGDETLRNSGFRLRLQLDANAKMPSEPYLCLWSEDQDFGLRRLSFESEAHFDRCPG